MKHIELTNKIIRKYFKLWTKLCGTSEEYPLCPFRLRDVEYIKRLGVEQGRLGAYQLFEIKIAPKYWNHQEPLVDLFAVYLDTGKVTMV